MPHCHPFSAIALAVTLASCQLPEPEIAQARHDPSAHEISRLCRAWQTPDGPGAECDGAARWTRFSICIPEPTTPELRGSIPKGDPMTGKVDPSQWGPTCPALVAPCEFGVACDGSGCSCSCDPDRGDGDCRTMTLGLEASSGTTLPVTSGCEAGRCVWRLQP